eukprot:scaffold451_cov365-Prasinococcus_capsulatus_cf.AAC.25
MAGGDQKWNKCFHTWPEPLPTTMLAPPNPDGTLTGVIVLPSQGERTWSTIMRSDKPSQAVRELLEDCFPDAYKDGVPQRIRSHVRLRGRLRRLWLKKSRLRGPQPEE